MLYEVITAFARVADNTGWERIVAHAVEKDETVRAAAARALGEWSSA